MVLTRSVSNVTPCLMRLNRVYNRACALELCSLILITRLELVVARAELAVWEPARRRRWHSRAPEPSS